MDRYINQEDILIVIDTEIEYAKLTGNFGKVEYLGEIRGQIEKMHYY